MSEWVSEWVSEVTQSCPTLCDPMDCSPQSSSVHGILQARVLEWVAISFSRGSSRPRDWTQVSCIAGRRFNLWATRKVLYTIHFHTHKKITCFINTVLQIFSLVSKKPLKLSLKVSFCKVSWCFLWLPCFAQTKQRYFMTHSYSSCFLISYPLIFSSL